MKKLILLLSIMISLSACVKTETVIELPTLPEIPQPQVVPFEDPKGTISQSDSLTYWTYNKMESDWNQNGSEISSNGVKISWNAYEYHGLKDKAVEDKIIQSIKEIIDKFKTYSDPNVLPAYAGMFKQYPKDGMKIEEIGIQTGGWFNYDNLLSIGVSATIYTKYPDAFDGRNGDFSYTISKTFDLNTGDEVHLSDLFVNGTDYVNLLNELVLMDAVGKTDPNPSYYEQWYQYNGGFKGIRGDIDFALSPDSLILFFDQSYPEFYDEFTTVALAIPYEKLKGVLAFQQRFASEDNLFTDTTIEKRSNYLVPVNTVIDVVTKDQTEISKIITTNTELSDFYIKLRNKIMASDQLLIDQAVKDKKDSVYYEFDGYPEGPYLNVVSQLSITSNNVNESYKVVRVTYKPDGTLFTFSDAFKPGSDYKSIIIQKMKDIASENYFTETYDYEAVYNTLNVMIISYDNYQGVRVFNTFFRAPAWDEGVFDMTFELSEFKDILLVEPW
jgi:hypothetical protein